METKKCPSCAEEIKKEAKKCPKCQKDLRNWFSRHPIITILLVVFVGIPILSGVFDTTSTNYNSIGAGTSGSQNNASAKIWQQGYYVDDFGDDTEDGYITTSRPIYGTFSNTATQDSRLKVDFIVNSKDDIRIMLYEYAGTNPVKAVSDDHYNLYIKDKGGNKHEMKAVNRTDRLHVENSAKLHDILMQGGEVSFIIKDTDFPTEYNFTIENADGYSDFY